MKIIKWFLVLLLTGFTYGQANLIFDVGVVESDDSITIDLGLDTKELVPKTVGGAEARAIAFVMSGTWTNDSLQVYAAVSPDSTYFPVYFNDAVLTLVATTGNSYIGLEPRHFAGIRYLMFVMPANEAANRTYHVVRRQY